MHFATAKEHRDFYHQHQWIEFEGLLTAAQCRKVADAIPEEGSKRDLWRDNPAIQKIVCSQDLAKIVAELTEAREIRIAFDQLLGPFPPVAAPLADITSVQGMIAGSSSAYKPPPRNPHSPSPISFPKMPASGSIFRIVSHPFRPA